MARGPNSPSPPGRTQSHAFSRRTAPSRPTLRISAGGAQYTTTPAAGSAGGRFGLAGEILAEHQSLSLPKAFNLTPKTQNKPTSSQSAPVISKKKEDKAGRSPSAKGRQRRFVPEEDQDAVDEDFFDEEADVPPKKKSLNKVEKLRKVKKVHRESTKPKASPPREEYEIGDIGGPRANQDGAVYAADIGGTVGMSLQESKILDEVWARHKASLGDGKPTSIDNEFWPDREVNLDSEFPSFSGPVVLKTADGRDVTGDEELKPGERLQVHPRASITIGINKRAQKAKAKEPKELPPHLTLPVAVDVSELSEESRTPVDLPKSGDKAVEAAPEEEKSPGVSFEALGVSPSLIEAMKAAWKIAKPTHIQGKTIPEIQSGHTVLVAAQTGTGKTLAYALPLLERLHKLTEDKYYRRRGQRTRSLIVVPNRELGMQITKVVNTLIANDKSGRFKNYGVFFMAGGLETPRREANAMMVGLDILITTPDRLLLHLEEKHLHLDDLSTVVFDEADTLVARPVTSEGIVNFVKILKKETDTKTIKRDVQNVFVSATVSRPLLRMLSRDFPAFKPSVSSKLHKSVDTVKQEFVFAAAGDFKKRLLFSKMNEHKAKRTIIFCNTSQNCKHVFKLLNHAGYNVTLLHSSLNRSIRAKNFETFENGNKRILVATDIASRGLDLGLIEHVILFDFPTNAVDYLHRIGRTARAGAGGYVTAFISKRDHALATQIRDTQRKGKSLAEIQPRPTQVPVRDWQAKGNKANKRGKRFEEEDDEQDEEEEVEQQPIARKQSVVSSGTKVFASPKPERTGSKAAHPEGEEEDLQAIKARKLSAFAASKADKSASKVHREAAK